MPWAGSFCDQHGSHGTRPGAPPPPPPGTPAEGVQVGDQGGDAAVAEVPHLQQPVMQPEHPAAVGEVVRDRPVVLVRFPELRWERLGARPEHAGQVEFPVGEGHLRVDHPLSGHCVAQPEVAMGERRNRTARQRLLNRSVAGPLQPGHDRGRYRRIAQVSADAVFGEEGRPVVRPGIGLQEPPGPVVLVPAVPRTGAAVHPGHRRPEPCPVRRTVQVLQHEPRIRHRQDFRGGHSGPAQRRQPVGLDRRRVGAVLDHDPASVGESRQPGVSHPAATQWFQ